MTALLKDRMRRTRRITHDLRPLAAGTKVFKGGLAICISQGTSQGYYAEATGGLTGIIVGVWEEDVDNTLGADGALSANIEFLTERNVEMLANDSGTPVTISNREQLCYVLDDQTVTGASVSAPAGVVYDVDANNRVHVEFDGIPAAVKTGASVQAVYTAKVVVTSLQANTGTTTNTLTASANGAWATQDGVTIGNMSVGDVVFIPAATTNLASPFDSGPWVLASLGSATTPWVLRRPSWFSVGGPVPQIDIVIQGLGTVWSDATWRTFQPSIGSPPTFTGVIGALDPTFYPRIQVVTTAAMTAGVSAANSTLFVGSRANIRSITPLPVTPGGTQGILRMSTVTAGYPGTSSLVVTSSSGTDTSTVQIQVTNF